MYALVCIYYIVTNGSKSTFVPLEPWWNLRLLYAASWTLKRSSHSFSGYIKTPVISTCSSLMYSRVSSLSIDCALSLFNKFQSLVAHVERWTKLPPHSQLLRLLLRNKIKKVKTFSSFAIYVCWTHSDGRLEWKVPINLMKCIYPYGLYSTKSRVEDDGKDCVRWCSYTG
jgi:hypothetical protein